MPPHGRMRNMNMSQFSVPSVSLCESFHCPPSTSFSWCTVETMATTAALSIKTARCNISETEKQMAKNKKPLWAPKVRCKKGKGESVTVRPLFFFLTLFSCVCLTSCSHGQLWGGWTLPVGVSGRGRRCPSATYSQLPPATSHLVQGRAQDSTQQSDVSAFIYSFSFLLSVESLPSYLCLIMWILSVALFVPGALWGAL